MSKPGIVTQERKATGIIVIQVNVGRPVLLENGRQPRGRYDVLGVPLVARPLGHDDVARAERSERVDSGRHDAWMGIDDACVVVLDEVRFEHDCFAADGKVEEVESPTHDFYERHGVVVRPQNRDVRLLLLPHRRPLPAWGRRRASGRQRQQRRRKRTGEEPPPIGSHRRKTVDPARARTVSASDLVSIKNGPSREARSSRHRNVSVSSPYSDKQSVAHASARLESTSMSIRRRAARLTTFAPLPRYAGRAMSVRAVTSA